MINNKYAAQGPDPTLAENWIKPTGNLNPEKLGNIVTELNCGCWVASDGSYIFQGCEDYIQLCLNGSFQDMRNHFVKVEDIAA